MIDAHHKPEQIGQALLQSARVCILLANSCRARCFPIRFLLRNTLHITDRKTLINNAFCDKFRI